MTERNIQEVVCDAGPLIHLAELGCLDLLNGFPRVFVADEVWREVEMHRPEVFSRSAGNWERTAPVIELDPDIAAASALFMLHSGETQSLEILKGRRDALFLTDDSAARLAARGLGFRVHGTVGVVVRSNRERQRTREQAIEILRSIPGRSTLFIRPVLLAEIIREVEQA